MSGLHPTDVKENYKDELEFVVNSLNAHKYIAIGEIGIDLYWDKSFLKQQQDAFRFQIILKLFSKLEQMQELEAPVSKMNLPLFPLILASKE